jgi:imidazolonepropionase-like amidohydrolase
MAAMDLLFAWETGEMDDELAGIELWDGTVGRGTSTLRWSTDSGRLTAVESAEAAPEQGGLSVVPGLIDTHVHLIGYAGTGSPDFLGWPIVTRPEEQTLHGLAQARRALAVGVTTVRDLSADDIQFSLRRALEQGIVEGPRVLAHGIVSMTGGHADMFTPAAVTQRRPTADGPDACRALVRHWARAGADGIKIATSGGVLSVGDKSAWRNHTSEEIAAIVDEAHALGMRVAAHAHTEDGIRRALDHGVDSLEHATLMTPELAERAVAAGVTVAPTLLINEVIAAGGAGVTAEQAGKGSELIERRDALLRQAAELGVDFVLGTDANGRHVLFGEQLDELRRMSAVLGWSPERTLQAGTSRAAAAIGIPELGRLEEGAPADFVVVRGRPWDELDVLRPENIVAVVRGGRVLVGALPGAGASGRRSAP